MRKTIEYEHGINGSATSIRGIDIHTELPKYYLSDFEKNIKRDLIISHPTIDAQARCGFPVSANGTIGMPPFFTPASSTGVARIRCDQLQDASRAILRQSPMPALPSGTDKIEVEVNFDYKAKTKNVELIINTNLFSSLVKEFDKRLELIL